MFLRIRLANALTIIRIPKAVEVICEYGFSECRWLTSGTLIAIVDYCNSRGGLKSDLTRIDIPAFVEVIG
jgi:hypothetical protein